LTISVHVAASNLDKPNLWFRVSWIHPDKATSVDQKMQVIDIAFSQRTQATKGAA